MFKGTRYFHDFNSGCKSGTSQILHEKKKERRYVTLFGYWQFVPERWLCDYL